MPKSFLSLLILALIPCCIEIDISVPSFPEMSNYFGVSEGMIQLTVAYNFLGFCLASVIYGPLSECYGRRKIMILGNAILLVGAAGCVNAPSIHWLLIARFIQGIGASTSAVVVFAIISDVYHNNPNNATKSVGIMNSIITILIAIAPVIGGFINKVIGWRGNYFIVTVISFISWILLLIFLPETKKALEYFDLKKITNDYKKLFYSSKFLSTSLVPSLLYSAYLSFVCCASFLYIEVFNLSIMIYVLHQAIIVGSFSITSFFCSKITQKFGTKKCIKKSMALCLLGSLILLIVSLVTPNSPCLITASMVIFCISFAICYPILFTLSLEIFPNIKGTASSAIMGMRALLVSAFVGATSYWYNGEIILISLVILSTVGLSCIFTYNLYKTGELF